MNVYLYSYECRTWFGTFSGLRNVYTSKQLTDNEVIELAKKNTNESTWSNKCNISLIMKYRQSIEAVFTYPNIAKIQHESFLNETKDT